MACIFGTSPDDRSTAATIGGKEHDKGNEPIIHDDIEVDKYLERFPLMEEENEQTIVSYRIGNEPARVIQTFACSAHLVSISE